MIPHFLPLSANDFEILFLKFVRTFFISAKNKVNDLMYIAGDMNLVEHVTLLREELVCSHASLLIFSSLLYSDVLNELEQLLWLTSWKQSEVILSCMNLPSSLFYPISLAMQEASWIM